MCSIFFVYLAFVVFRKKCFCYIVFCFCSKRLCLCAFYGPSVSKAYHRNLHKCLSSMKSRSRARFRAKLDQKPAIKRFNSEKKAALKNRTETYNHAFFCDLAQRISLSRMSIRDSFKQSAHKISNCWLPYLFLCYISHNLPYTTLLIWPTIIPRLFFCCL